MDNDLQPSLIDTATGFFDNLIAFRMIRWSTSWLPGVRWWLRTLVFCAMGSILFIGASLIARERAVGGVTAALVFVYSAIMVARITGLRVLEILQDEIVGSQPDAPSHPATIESLERRATPGRQVLTSLIVALVLLALVAPAALQLFDRLTFVFWAVFATLFWFLAMDLLYFFIVITMTVLEMVQDGHILYPLDPSKSTFVHGATAIARQMVWLVSITASVGVLITPLVITVDLELAFLTAFSVFILLLIGILTLYVIQQRSLSRIVARHKAQTLADLQAQIQALYAQVNTLQKDDRDRLRTLIELHDQVAARQERAINFTGALRFLAPLLLPLATILLNNLNLPFSNLILDILNQVM